MNNFPLSRIICEMIVGMCFAIKCRVKGGSFNSLSDSFELCTDATLKTDEPRINDPLHPAAVLHHKTYTLVAILRNLN